MMNADKSDRSDQHPDRGRRRLLIATTTVVGAAGLVAVGIPFIDSFWPSERARLAGAPVKVDISRLSPGQQITVEWRGRPVWVLWRTPEMLKRMQSAEHLQRLRDPNSDVESQQPAYARNAVRAIHPQHLVVIGICTHLGCVPTFRPDVAPPDLGPHWIGGYFCPCHGSRFDFAGRVYKRVPAPTNLVIPPYRYLSASMIEVGVDTQQGAESAAGDKRVIG